MKNEDVLYLLDSLNQKRKEDKKSIFSNLKGEKFLYALNKNRNIIKAYMIDIREDFRKKVLINYPEQSKYSDYTKEVYEVNKKYNNPIQEVLNKKNIENKKEKPDEKVLSELETELTDLKNLKDVNYDKELKDLESKYSIVIEQNKLAEEEWLKYVKNEANIKFHLIQRKDIPKEIDDEQYALIYPLVDDVEEEKCNCSKDDN
jgi:hypothetical protein